MRGELIQVRSTKEEKRVIEKAAKSSGMSVSDYTRAAVLMLAMLDGEGDAWKLAAGLVRERMARFAAAGSMAQAREA